VFEHYGEYLCVANVASLLFCVFLYFKGIYFPSTSDSGKTG
jgi:7-dehydrocholesterol reductase